MSFNLESTDLFKDLQDISLFKACYTNAHKNTEGLLPKTQDTFSSCRGNVGAASQTTAQH